MANKNRTEVAASIEALAAVVDLEELKEAVNDFFAQSCIFRKDVAATDSSTGSKTLDFLDIDYLAVSQNAAFATYTLSNVQQGEIKYLKVTKSSGQRVGFASPAIDTTPAPDVFLTDTEVLYKITNKDGTNIYVTPISAIVGEASDTVSGIQENATTVEAQALSVNNKTITPSTLADVNAGLLTKIVSIGDWNMDTTTSVSIAHGVTAANIRTVFASIIRDDSLVTYDINTAGAILWDSADIGLSREVSGIFDDVLFDSTSFNRGYITIQYLP